MAHHILLIEDEVEMCYILSLILGRAGYRVSVSRDGSDLFGQKPLRPDLILLDKHLEREDGLKICDRIKSDPALHRTIVVMLSAAPVTSVALKHARADDFVLKPFDTKKLITLISKHLTGLSGTPEASGRDFCSH